MTQTKAELLQTRHQGDIRLGDADSTHYVGFKAPATVGTSLVWTLPAADGTANYLLKTDGSGNLGWVADSSTDSTKMPLAGGNFSGHVTFLDNIKAKFGSGGDLEIFHDTNDSYITNTGVGNLIIRGDDVHIQGSNGENMVNCNEDGSVDISFNNVKKFETSATGTQTTGNINLSGELNFTGNASKFLDFETLDNSHRFEFRHHNPTGNVFETAIKCTANEAVELFHNNVKKLNTSAAGIEITGVTATDPSATIYHSDADVEGEWLRLGRTDLNTIRYHSLKAKHGGGATSNEISFFLHNGSTTTSQTEVLTLTGTGSATLGGAIYGPVKTVSALELDLSTGNYFIKTISGNSTFTFANPAASGTVTAFTLELTHSSGTVTWPSSVKWNADTAPTLTTGKTHLFMFVTDDGGTRYRGSALVDYVN